MHSYSKELQEKALLKYLKFSSNQKIKIFFNSKIQIQIKAVFIQEPTLVAHKRPKLNT